MEQLRLLLARLSLRQKVTIVLAAVVMFGGVLVATRWNKERDFRPLYREVSAQDAGAVLAKLRETGVDYRVGDNGGTILVPSAKVAEVRLQMAAAGLPKTGRLGFELFDGTDLGSTEFAEQVKYHRAIEGELERSVMSLAEVESARVHVTFPKDSLFAENRQPAKASVMVKLRVGAKLAPANVVAICHLAASAVEGLQPEAVSVLDMQGNLLMRPRSASGPDGLESSDSMLEMRQKMERDVLAKIHGTLEPLLGADKYRAGVSLECDFTSGEQSEETYDPGRSVMVSSQRSEESSGALAAAGGAPGTASNLPRSSVRAGSPTGTGLMRRTENTSYQSSRLVKRLRLPVGAVRKMSISVLLDQTVQWEGSGAKLKKVLVPPTPERMKVIRDVIAGITGFQADRGDQIIVETLPFESTLTLPPPESAAPPAAAPANESSPSALIEKWKKQFGMPLLLAAAGGVLLLLLAAVVLAWFMLRGRGKKKISAHATPALKGAPGVRGEVGAADAPSLEEQLTAKLAENVAAKERQEQELLTSLSMTPVSTNKTEVLRKHIREQTKKDATAMAHIIRSWLAEGQER